MKPQHTHEVLDGKDKWSYGKLYVERSTPNDAFPITRQLRRADRCEIAALTREPALQVIADGITHSAVCFTIRRTDTEEPIGVYGVRESGHPNSGVVWLVGTEDITTFSNTFLRGSREWVDKLHIDHGLLYNVIDARNEVHIHWLRWMGFDMLRRIPEYGIERREFILFSRYAGV